MSEKKSLRPWFDDGRLDPDRVHEALMEFSPAAMDDPKVRDLFDMACDLLDEVNKLRDKIEEVHTYIPARDE